MRASWKASARLIARAWLWWTWAAGAWCTPWPGIGLMSNDRRPTSESADIQCEFMGVEWKLGGGRRQTCSGEHEHLHSWSHDLLWLWTCRSFERGCSKELPGSADLPHLDALPHSYPGVRSQCEPLLFEWAWSSCSLLLSLHLCNTSQSHSDSPKAALLPAATETGHLWLFKELLLSHFLDDESGSILGLWGVTLGLAGENSTWPRDAGMDSVDQSDRTYKDPKGLL